VTSSRKSHGGLAGLQLLMAQPAGQVVIAVRLRALPGVLRTCRIAGVACARNYAQLCITFHDSASALTSQRQLLRKVLIWPHRARSPNTVAKRT
jgi:hypothetical protein